MPRNPVMKKYADNQRRYWDTLSDDYHRITRISCDDYHHGPQIPGESKLQLLPPLVVGQTALELGCGGAQNSIWLARRGLVCTAADISAAQLRHARELAAGFGVELNLVQTSLEEFHRHVPGEFDLIHSSHAFEFVCDPAAIIRQIAAHLKPGGNLVLSTIHPLYNGEWIELVGDGEESGSADASGLFLTNYFEPPEDRRDDEYGTVCSRAWPLSAWFGWLRAAGLDVVALAEPRPLPPGSPTPYTSDDWGEADAKLQAVPISVIFVARRLAT